MDLIKYSDHYFARYVDPQDVEVDALLVALSHSATGTEVRLRAVDTAPIESRDGAMASDLVAGNASWFPDNGLSDAEVRARLTPSTGVGGAMVVVARAADKVTVFREGRTVDFGDVRVAGGHVRVRVRLVNVGVRIYAEQARGVWELRWLNLTPMRLVVPRDDFDDADPPEEVCRACEVDLRARVGATLARVRAEAERACAEALARVDAVNALPALRGTAEWRARVEELEEADADNADDADDADDADADGSG